jgi:hypothetical protein
MTTKEYEKQLQDTVDPTINFREHPVNKDIVGIYYGDAYTETAIPALEINAERQESYTDNFGYPHRGYIEATERVIGFIERFKTDEGFRNDVLGIEEDEDTVPEQE